MYLSSIFPIENSLKRGNALSPLLFSFVLEYAIRKEQETRLGLDMNGTHQVLAFEDDENLIEQCRSVSKCLWGYWFSSKHREN